MSWFYWVLFAFLAQSVFWRIKAASKGIHQQTLTPGVNATAAVINILLAVGILYFELGR